MEMLSKLNNSVSVFNHIHKCKLEKNIEKIANGCSKKMIF